VDQVTALRKAISAYCDEVVNESLSYFVGPSTSEDEKRDRQEAESRLDALLRDLESVLTPEKT
jgi:DNA-binding FrmR family transcriptional regulator